MIFENILTSFMGPHILILTSLPHYERCRGIIEYMTRIVERVPKHRLVSTQGYVSDGLCIEKLQAEGFTILPAKGNRTERVLDYKKYLFNFKGTPTVNKAVLDQIQREGLSAFL